MSSKNPVEAPQNKKASRAYWSLRAWIFSSCRGNRSIECILISTILSAVCDWFGLKQSHVECDIDLLPSPQHNIQSFFSYLSGLLLIISDHISFPAKCRILSRKLSPRSPSAFVITDKKYPVAFHTLYKSHSSTITLRSSTVSILLQLLQLLGPFVCYKWFKNPRQQPPTHCAPQVGTAWSNGINIPHVSRLGINVELSH